MDEFIVAARKWLPAPLKSMIWLILYWMSAIRFRVKYGFFPPPKGTDLVGYEVLLEEIVKYGCMEVEGDFVEIGCFLGGGTYKLSKFLSKRKSQKIIYVIDIFDITADNTQNTSGQVMSEIYASVLKGRDQWQVFCQVTRGLKNIVVLKGDSKGMSIPTKKVAFAFIDGNHEPSYVINDFYLVWPKLSIGGIVAFDDYGYDLPQVTETIDQLLMKHLDEIEDYWVKEKVIFIRKGAGGC
ncbi:MAG: class I SAM-dependent methyltransferase [Candidatus Methanomethylicaceae archaeon]